MAVMNMKADVVNQYTGSQAYNVVCLHERKARIPWAEPPPSSQTALDA